ncbi:uncharacterized protein pdzph1 isoform X1 [Astyanax mexicanus]|uniref:uncharacterized protein pdzph1 isoform X1 n=2 Tax=Astyanax mexicanus TaxID=7994 RepID=UPI0020CB28B0|nr:uncharacterized protein pdzph1 isoform X1 [Astyanax mexicanus]
MQNISFSGLHFSRVKKDCCAGLEKPKCFLDAALQSRMSKRRGRNSRRRRSSCSSKQSNTTSSSQNHMKSPLDNVVQADETTEKGETDSFCKENNLSDQEEKEQETPRQDNLFRRASYGDLYGDTKVKMSLSDGVDKDKGLKITHSVTIDDFGRSAPKIIFQRSHESAAGEIVSSVIAVTTAKVKCVSSSVRLEINEVVQSEDSDFKTTLVLQSEQGKATEACFQSQKVETAGSSQAYPSWSQCTTGYNQNAKQHCENVSYKVSIAELKTDVKDMSCNPSSLGSQDEIDCCKSCCKDHFCGHSAGGFTDTDFTLVDGSSTCSSPIGFWLPQRQLSLPESLCNETLWDIPPPIEFADKESDVLQNLTHNVESCQIHDDVFKEPGNPWNKDTGKCQLDLDNDESRFKPVGCDQFDLEGQEHLYTRTPVSRSSFTKNFIESHEGKMRLRNNSIAILETKTQANSYMEVPTKRRRTFPGVAYPLNQARESIPSCRESFSSGTLSSFFMRSLPSQAERTARFYVDDDRLGPFERESRKSSSSSSYRPSSCSIYGQDNIKAYSTTKNPFYPTRSDETSEDVFLKSGQEDPEDPEAEVGELMRSAGRSNTRSSSAGPLEQSEVTESGFDEEMVEMEETSLIGLAEDFFQNNLLIQVIPPSPYNSEEHICDGAPQSRTKTQTYEDQEVVGCQKKRSGSVMTIIIGAHEQRFLQNSSASGSMSEDISQNNQQESAESATETCSAMSEPVLASPSEQLDVEKQCMEESNPPSDQQMTSVSSCCPSENQTETPLEMNPADVLEMPNEDVPAKRIQNYRRPSREEAMASNRGRQTSMGIRRTSKSYQSDMAERQSTPKSLDFREHLKPPGDCALKDSEENSDHWAKKRKLFKETKQWSSAGGSSITSNITEESDTVNSEDARSVDMSIEDRGFYTETFHSASWIYRGDDVNPTETAQGLSNRPHPVAVRERTVKINKGLGEYPWGFRIQFSKPIVVTEVDTNGAAEEAGLQVGDYVLAVNGTDVTSVPHSEAADLARQGPDLLTLTIGSDIGRTPNTPRPACRGYLHKRTQSSLLKGWRKRWFVLRHDCCLYYYRNKRDEGKSRALSAMKLEGAVVEADSSLGKPFVFKCCPVSGTRVYYFCATSNQEMRRWLEAMERAVHPITQNHVWVDVTRHNSNMPPLAVKNPECLGLLHLLDRSKDSWVQHYCILKDGCLYFYGSIRSTYAVGGIYLHGYLVREQPLGSKRSTIELKPPSEEFKVFHLCAENANENKRWIVAIKASIGKWLPLHQAIQDYMSRPPEATRM